MHMYYNNMFLLRQSPYHIEQCIELLVVNNYLLLFHYFCTNQVSLLLQIA